MRMEFQKQLECAKQDFEKNYIRETSVVKSIQAAKRGYKEQNQKPLTYFEFLFQQMHFMQKKWWGLQALVLVVFWGLLKDSDAVTDSQRLLGVGAALFVIFIIPELWKNRQYGAVEIEGTTLYSLRQIYAARFLVMALVDGLLVSLFIGFAYYTLQLSLVLLVVNFLLPFTITTCICFRFLCSPKKDAQYGALLFCMVWLILWSYVLTSEAIYQTISLPLWCTLLFVAVIYLIYCIGKIMRECQAYDGGTKRRVVIFKTKGEGEK